MKAVFGRWLPLFLSLLIFQVIVLVIVVIWTFRDSQGVLGSAADFISKSPVAVDIFTVITDYAEIISGFVVVVALVILFISIRKYQRGKAVNRLHNWARNSVVTLAQYRQAADTGDSVDKWEEARVVIVKLTTDYKSILSDARVLGGEIHDKTRVTVSLLRGAREKLVNEDESLFEDLQTLQHDFADIMILAFEFIK